MFENLIPWLTKVASIRETGHLENVKLVTTEILEISFIMGLYLLIHAIKTENH